MIMPEEVICDIPPEEPMKSIQGSTQMSKHEGKKFQKRSFCLAKEKCERVRELASKENA